MGTFRGTREFERGGRWGYGTVGVCIQSRKKRREEAMQRRGNKLGGRLTEEGNVRSYHEGRWVGS